MSCHNYARFPWHLASHGPSQHKLVKGILAYQIESGPAGQKGQSKKETLMRSDTMASARWSISKSLIMAEVSQAVLAAHYDNQRA